MYEYSPDSEACADSEFIFFDAVVFDSLGWVDCSQEYGYNIFSESRNIEILGAERRIINYELNLIIDIFSVSPDKLQKFFKYNNVVRKSFVEGIGISEFSFSEGKLYGDFLTYTKIDGFEYGEIVGVKDIEDNNQRNFKLHQNYPNPFNPSTIIEFDLPYSTEVKLKIYNLLGEEVKTLIDEYKDAGNHQVEFKAENLSSGVYIYRLVAGSRTFSGKMNLLK